MYFLRYKQIWLLLSIFLAVGLYFFPYNTEARNITEYRDTLSDSAPSEYSNHTVQFKILTDIPAGGFVKITPNGGSFNIPVASFDHQNVEIFVATSSGYQLRLSTTTADATYDGVAITYGTSGDVTITLNSSLGIPSGASVRILMGDHTTLSSTADTGFLNPATTGTLPIHITYGGGNPGNARALVAIIENVTVGPADTKETVPPFRFNGAPSGSLSGTLSSVEISLETDEFSICKYSTASGTPYASMPTTFTNTGLVVHRRVVSVAPSTSYTFYVRCIDDEGNFNIDDFLISFDILEAPTGTPGTGDEDTGEDAGSGTGTGDTGGGSGSSGGGGSGGVSGGSGGGQSSSGGGGSSSGGAGGFETNNSQFPSGDARIIINGTAFPNSEVYVLVDSFLATSKRTSSNGTFSILVDGISRGTHTFGIYAIDSGNVRSSTFSTSFSVIGERGSTLSNINLMPTIKVTPDPVEIGAKVTFSGFAIPNTRVVVETRPDTAQGNAATLFADASSNGSWSVDLVTTGFGKGTWKVRAKSTDDSGNNISNYSQYTFYGVGELASQKTSTSDLNRDGKVNIIDFSILLFWWNGNGGASDPPADINRNGRVGIEDFSIMLFNWTG